MNKQEILKLDKCPFCGYLLYFSGSVHYCSHKTNSNLIYGHFVFWNDVSWYGYYDANYAITVHDDNLCYKGSCIRKFNMQYLSYDTIMEIPFKFSIDKLIQMQKSGFETEIKKYLALL